VDRLFAFHLLRWWVTHTVAGKYLRGPGCDPKRVPWRSADGYAARFLFDCSSTVVAVFSIPFS
jgi:hypothetical protein